MGCSLKFLGKIFVFLFGTCLSTLCMAMYNKDTQEKIEVDIGGSKFTTTRGTIESSGGKVLKMLLQKQQPNANNQITIFIDRPQAEALLLQAYMCTGSIPSTDQNMVDAFTDFFDFPKIKMPADKAVEFRFWSGNKKSCWEKKCPECGENYNIIQYNIFAYVKHLVANHSATIYCNDCEGDYFHIMYSIEN